MQLVAHRINTMNARFIAMSRIPSAHSIQKRKESHPMNPRVGVLNRPMLGKTIGRSDALTPYQDASVAAYCSTDAVGIQRPRLSVSDGPPSCSSGKRRPFGPGTP